MNSNIHRRDSGIIRTHYLDTSAIVKLVVSEDGSESLRSYRSQHSIFYTTSLCLAETLGVLKGKYLKNLVSQEQYLTACDILLGQVRAELLGVDEIKIADQKVYSEVDKLAKKYSIDISDAFQIVTLKEGFFSRMEGDSEPILITADETLAMAARREGLRVWDCLREAAP